MEKRPKVSVIIPTYNRRDYVVEAIDSVLAQAYKDFEIIVVDDGSTDGTGEILKEKYGNNIRYFYKQNGGCASARNYGIKMAQGEYIAFLDSDDKYLPKKLEDQVGILEKNNAIDFVYSDSYLFEGKKQRWVKAVRPDKDGSVTYPLFMTTYMQSGSFVVRRTCVDISGFYNEIMRYNEDTDYLLRLSINCKAYHSDKPTVAQRSHTGRKSSNNVKLLEAVYFSSEQFLKEHPSFRKRIGQKADKRLAQIKLDLSMEHLIQRDVVKAMEQLNGSQELYPNLRKRLYLYLLEKRWGHSSIIYRTILLVETIRKIAQWDLSKYARWF